MPPSLFSETVLPTSVFRSARTSSMPRSPPPVTLLLSSQLPPESRTRRPALPFAVTVLPLATLAVVPLTREIPPPLLSRTLRRTTLSATLNSSTAATSLRRRVNASTTLDAVSGKSRTP